MSLLREHFPLEQMNTKEKGIPSPSGHHLLLSWNNCTAWKLWKYDISFHSLLHNQQQSLTNLQPVSMCVLQHKCRKHRILIRKSSLFQQHPRCTKYAGESKELTTQRSQRYTKAILSQFQPGGTSLMPQPNCVTVTTRPNDCSATLWPGEQGVHSFSSM